MPIDSAMLASSPEGMLVDPVAHLRPTNTCGSSNSSTSKIVTRVEWHTVVSPDRLAARFGVAFDHAPQGFQNDDSLQQGSIRLGDCFMLRFIVVSCVVAFIGSAACHGDDPAPGRQVEQSFSSSTRKATLGYLLYLPPEWTPNAKVPLLLFLHGSGERGNDLALVMKHGPPRLVDRGQHLPLIVVSPQCPAETRWEPELLLELLDSVQARYAADPDQVFVSGLSMGGSGTWDLVARAPERFAAAMPICGKGNVDSVAALARVPVWIIVGDRDREMLVTNCREMARLLNERQADVKLSILHGVGHDSWTLTYSTPEMYDWMLRHRRKK